jgi:uncharacterized protein YbaR (Trm112 family)
MLSYIVNMTEYTVSLYWDEEASRWYALNDEIPIMLEDTSFDRLIHRIKTAVPELLELNGKLHENIQLLFKIEAQAVLA